ncbi:MAG: alpha/beta hydrolase [Gammaproteobacteria bacterium]|nr:alpha/beta hydrolase [Gammaproteobacteria bacterium]MYF28322.1 alpha/beta hydrolase [Gammaproteobacteria bacterium]MYK44805.1 alpha/beta hydrolase [Gammaproteobacteria bacterium]
MSLRTRTFLNAAALPFALALAACANLNGGSSPMTIEQTQMKAGDYTYEVRRAGHGDDLVILLHGFPETSHMWLPLLEHLAANGYTALAPDLRGYSPGATPPEAEHYSHASMAGDILAMADALGKERFHLVGHDHGAGLGWYMAGRHADRLISWTALSVPHIDAFGDAIANNPEQRQRSGYMQFFRQVGTAEAALSANDFAALRNIWSASSPEQVEEYVRVLSQPGAMTGALNWYRGGITPDRRPVGKISVPTVLIWGNQDSAIGRPGVTATPPLMEGPYRLVELDVGHWLIQEAEADVLRETLAHIQQFGD